MELDISKIWETAQKALDQPFYSFRTVVNGFLVDIRYDGKMFSSCISFKRHWPHTQWAYGDTVDMITGTVAMHLRDALRCFPKGGDFGS